MSPVRASSDLNSSLRVKFSSLTCGGVCVCVCVCVSCIRVRMVHYYSAQTFVNCETDTPICWSSFTSSLCARSTDLSSS